MTLPHDVRCVGTAPSMLSVRSSKYTGTSLTDALKLYAPTQPPRIGELFQIDEEGDLPGRDNGGASTPDTAVQTVPDATAAVLARLRDRNLEDLPWTDAAQGLRDRVAFLRGSEGDHWPDWSTAALAETLEEWLLPYIGLPTGFDRFYRLDLASILRGTLGYPLAGEIDQLAPKEIALPSGRKARVDYADGAPRVAVRVQEMFGSSATPMVGRRPVILELLSPAGRPLQITTDLGGFWAGSWSEVRKEMAGRYPKHDWPQDPANATPKR